ncbi:hypothetical protein CORC01_13073 [Colletotrichum orchidophilum]|uniref:Uncharacterized protein n=1 Tax=Colletotrichum orchidophilum TaxID=1209926 RepID=A0A1G4AR33_9PEZI|nr:uncharacterized protein CORC01_13073 [Colletotrichum orchidophilum]OHE91637.1 hypothetical protein CORC01_13073 [Colletotrichum orchidophilum]
MVVRSIRNPVLADHASLRADGRTIPSVLTPHLDSSLALIRKTCTTTSTTSTAMRQKQMAHEQSAVDHDLVYMQSLGCCCSLSLFFSSTLQLPELEQCAAGRSIRGSLTRRHHHNHHHLLCL